MPPEADRGAIVVHLDELLAARGKARAVRFTTLAALCAVLDCQPGDPAWSSIRERACRPGTLVPERWAGIALSLVAVGLDRHRHWQ